MRVDFPYLISDRDRRNNLRYYVRRNGRKIRIREKYGTEAFALAYADALRAGVRRKIQANVREGSDGGRPLAVILQIAELPIRECIFAKLALVL